jgi:hypothetical protein
MRKSFQELLRSFASEVILEKASGGQKLDTLTREIGKLVIKGLKSPEVYEKIYKKMPSSFEIPDTDIKKLDILPVDSIKVNFEFDPVLDPLEMRVSGKYDSSPYKSVIEIFIVYPDRPFRVTDIEDIYSKIVGGIRHEIEHVAQYSSYGTQRLPAAPRTLKQFIQYYLDPSELEAYVTEAHMKSRANKTPMSEELEAVFDEALHNADVAGLSLDELDFFEEAIRSNYTEYAKKRYSHSMG